LYEYITTFAAATQNKAGVLYLFISKKPEEIRSSDEDFDH
jgi:hypothetical protein